MGCHICRASSSFKHWKQNSIKSTTNICPFSIFQVFTFKLRPPIGQPFEKKNEDLGNLSIDKSTFKSTMSHDRTWRPFWRQLHFVFSFLKGILGPRSSLSTQEYYEVISDLRWLYTTQHHLKLSTMQGHIKKGAETQVWPCVRRAFTESWEAHVQNVYKEGPKIFAHLHLEQLFMICVVHTQVSLQWYAAEVKP